MPTGYTADIQKGISFEKFALNCARAFGALITMRDDPNDAPIPDEIKPHEYSKERLAEAEASLELTKTISLKKALENAIRDYKEQVDCYQKSLKKDAELRVKYEDMLTKIKVWQPPTPDHQGLKDFMVEQIQRSIEFDCGIEHLTIPELLTAQEWLNKHIERLIWDIKYHTEEWQKEQGRCRDRTAWIWALKESLKRNQRQCLRP